MAEREREEREKRARKSERDIESGERDRLNEYFRHIIR